MARIEWYAETNSKLNSSLTPANRCTDKTTALQNNADPAPLADFEPNRLVPTTAGYVKLWEHLIRFKNYDGTVLQEKYVPHNSVPSYTGSTPTRTGYTFTGWSPTPVAATADADYIAQFTVNSYTITYINNVDSQSTTRSVSYGDTAPSITPWSISGYTFDHWDKPFGVVTGDDTYTAYYTQNVTYYTVTYTWTVPGGSTYTETETVQSGSTPSNIPSPQSVSDYTGSWSPNPYGYAITGDITFAYNYTYSGPVTSTAGPFCVQGGADYNAVYEDLGSNGDSILKYFQLTNPVSSGTTPINFTLHITGWVYDHSTGTFTEISSADNATITVQNYRHVASQSGYDSTGTTLTMSQNLYDLGLRWFQNDSSQSLFVNTLSQTYYYLHAAEHSSLWCPNHDRNWLFTFNVSCDDLPSGRTLSASTGQYKGYATLPGGTINNLSSDSRVAVETSVHLYV